jgi:hypothetical protein
VQFQPTIERNDAPQISRREIGRFMLLSLFTLGLYSAYLILSQTPVIGQLVGRRRLGFGTAVALTVLTVGIFPGVYLVVLAFDLERYSRSMRTVGCQRNLGILVLILDVISLFTAVCPFGVATVIVSEVTWSLACWLLFKELNLYATTHAQPQTI